MASTFSRFQRESFSKYVYIALYGTALSPMITEVALQFGNYWQKLLAVMLCGIIIGFMLPPLATYCLRVHQGYNLYNVGFAAGLVGTLLVSIMKSFGYEVDNSLSWTYENNWIVVAYILTLSLGAVYGSQETRFNLSNTFCPVLRSVTYC